jgi:hypothetical protein
VKTHDPHFMVDVTLYPAEMDGRTEPIAREGFGCPCMLDEKSNTFADCRLFLSGQHISPGETKRVGIRFSFDPAALLFRSAGKFYLWDGRVIGEAVVAVP